ncbi:MAG: hypothetical protein HYU63_02385 [Armatimonadetes bacterium]|nr:hypothetical protein [Armatimonadota bacterium]
MPSASNAAAPTTNYYNTNLLALNLSYDFNLNEKIKALATLNYLTSINERVSEGVLQAASLITIPARSDPAGANRSQGWFSWANVGPQKEGIAGGSLTLNFPHNFKLIGEYSSSKYVPDLSFTNFRGTTLPIKGALFRGAIEYNPQNWNFNLDYVAVAPTYDPMLFAYPSSATIPVFLPYSTFYSNYYQLHDNLKYPNNRQGFKFSTAYNFKQGKVNLSYGSLEQKFSSNRRNLLSTGFIEVFFPELRGGTMEEKGDIKDLGLTLNYTFPNNLKTNIAYYNYKIKRASANLNDDMDLAENVGQFGLAYPFNRKFSLSGNYTLITYKGHFVDQTNQNFRQYIPSLSASYQMSSNALVLATYRVYDFTNNAVAASNWNGRQTTLEVKFNF